MQLDAKLDSYDISGMCGAIKQDLDSGNLQITKTGNNDWSANIRSAGGEKLPTSLQKYVEQLLNNAFKEGCKCGKGGFSPY